MKKKNKLIFAAFMLGLGSGWSVLNQDIFANGSDVLPDTANIVEDASNSEISDSASDAGSDPAPSLSSTDPDLHDSDDTEDVQYKDVIPNTEAGVNTENDPGKTAESDQEKDNLSKSDPSADEIKHDLDSGSVITEANEQPNSQVMAPVPAEKPVTVVRKAAAKAALNGWVNNKYYVNNEVSKGEVVIGGQTHLFNNDGNPLTGFMYYNGKYIYCDGQGKILKGNHQVGNMSFSADQSGNIYATSLNNVPYYNQTDGRWGNLYYGGRSMSSTGCVVMAATAVVNYFTGSSYSPIDMGNILYSAGYYNTSQVDGTISSAWRYIANRFGLTYQNNLSRADAEKALKEGKIVAGAVGYSKWCPYSGVTHEIYLAGYNNGNTYVRDPLHSYQCGQASLSSVYSVLSGAWEDVTDGGPMFAIGRSVIPVLNTNFSSNGTVVIGDQNYTGKAVTAKPIVGFYQNGKYIQLSEGKDYSLSYANNVNPGQATVTVTGKGLYKGVLKKAFYIVNQTIADSTYAIKSAGNQNLVIDINAASKSSGVRAQLYGRNDTNAQKYRIQKQSNGYYTIQNINSGLYLMTSSDWRNVHDGLAVTQQKLRNDLSSYWMLRSTSNGYVISTAWDSKFVLDVPAASFKNGTKLQLYTGNGSKAQLWRLEDLIAPLRELDNLAQKNIETVKDGYYRISSALNSSKVIDIAGAGTANGTNAQIYTNNQSNAQVFRFTHVNGGYLRIENINSNKVLDVYGANKANGTNVSQYGWNGTRAQMWIAVKMEKGLKFVSALDPNCVLDLTGANTNNSANIQLYRSNDSLAQRWNLQQVEDPRKQLNDLALKNKDVIKNGTYEIHSGKNGAYNVDVNAGSKSKGANVQLYSDNNTNAQRWTVEHDQNQYVSFKNIGSGLYLGVNGTNVVQTNQNSYSTKWIVESVNGGMKIISALNKSMVLDLNGGLIENFRNIQIYQDNGTNAQKWNFVKV